MKYIPIFLLIIIILIPAVTLLGLKKETGLKQTDEYKKIFFYKNRDFVFSFISPKARLNSIVLKMWNLSIENNKPVYINLLSDQKIIRSLRLNDSNMPNGEMLRLSFPEITDSKNKRFTLVLNAPETEKDDVLGVYTNAGDHPVMTTFHTLSSRSQLILDTYNNFFNKILFDKTFFVIWLILFIISQTPSRCTTKTPSRPP
ncbi:hypothetical protein A3D83_01030 [Candidatus Daviesbacteria bacterium RIFCSPHIGHO2_02_FULL_41_10]|uniref:Uncharacterized protein n=1 Tax=Candidatus Daviesbacteria bacterium RIFCSPHIGHO2_02_FULL_41_10 TaxID=1797774 RepID=A0A1F5JY06_9BACT|nr:MAG: hypothetical protein A3D83_01030 [Candidatus Daviesbacteria bacterium RIFCSPHIGHO2_02_FULL_41_10]